MNTPEIDQSVDDLIPIFTNLLEEGKSEELRDGLEGLHPSTLSDLLTNISSAERSQFLQHITGLDSIAQLTAHANITLREEMIELLDDSRLAAIIRRLDLDDAADILSFVSRRRQVKVLKRLNPGIVKELTTLLAYDGQTAGGIMNPRFLALDPEEMTQDAITHLKHSLLSKEIVDDTDLSNCFVTDPRGKLLGIVTLRELLGAPDNVKIETIMDRSYVSIGAETHQEDAAWKIADYDLSSLPVVSDENIIIGIITVDDILDVITEEHEEDLSKLIGTNEDDRVGASVLVSIKSRLPWLLASFCGGIIGAYVLGSFTDTLQQIVALAFFMPVVFGMGGNVGAQSSTITVRGLSTGELAQSRIFERLLKELYVGLSLGLFFAVLLATASYLMFQNPNLSFVVGFSITVTMMCAATTGSILPIIFEKLGFDPAIAAGPFVATSNDILSIVIYFSVATFLLI